MSFCYSTSCYSFQELSPVLLWQDTTPKPQPHLVLSPTVCILISPPLHCINSSFCRFFWSIWWQSCLQLEDLGYFHAKSRYYPHSTLERVQSLSTGQFAIWIRRPHSMATSICPHVPASRHHPVQAKGPQPPSFHHVVEPYHVRLHAMPQLSCRGSWSTFTLSLWGYVQMPTWSRRPCLCLFRGTRQAEQSPYEPATNYEAHQLPHVLSPDAFLWNVIWCHGGPEILSGSPWPNQFFGDLSAAHGGVCTSCHVYCGLLWCFHQ